MQGLRGPRTCSKSPTSSTSRGCGQRRGASGWPRASIRLRAAPRWPHLDAITIRYRASSRASALLLAGWLCARLHWEPKSLRADGREGLAGTACRGDDEVQIALEITDQDVPGLAGVTVSCGEAYALSLDRAAGGLRARERARGDEREWRVLGASRGEGGILGEGVRQALLRDPTYGPALGAARGFCTT